MSEKQPESSSLVVLTKQYMLLYDAIISHAKYERFCGSTENEGENIQRLRLERLGVWYYILYSSSPPS